MQNISQIGDFQCLIILTTKRMVYNSAYRWCWRETSHTFSLFANSSISYSILLRFYIYISNFCFISITVFFFPIVIKSIFTLFFHGGICGLTTGRTTALYLEDSCNHSASLRVVLHFLYIKIILVINEKHQYIFLVLHCGQGLVAGEREKLKHKLQIHSPA